MIQKNLQHIMVYQHEIFNDFPELIQITTTRMGGYSSPPFDALNLGENTADDPELIERNTALVKSDVSFLARLEQYILPVQVHGNNIVTINEDFLNKDQEQKELLLSSCDALITSLPAVFIGIRTADCVPVTVYNKHSGIIGVIHAGWRGIAKGIIGKTLKMMGVEHSPENLFCGIGPCIERDNYEVGQEVIDEIEKVLPGESVWFIQNGSFYFDLKKAARIQIEQVGVSGSNIESCTFCTWKNNTEFYSYRKENGNTGRFLTGMMIKS
ncbi:peptidoglycan editing factor PgeF [Saccharicrinis sp. FJH2]|uniref:peptidoglycan editing factor PgeF n=1 Tax=Saccharicrinis sp. FJH65 TaxID=3344659 RepID=UPI0035F4DD91